MPKIVFRAAVASGLVALSACAPAIAAADPLASLTKASDRTVMTLHAKGEQIYECRSVGGDASVWTFKAPRAELSRDGDRVGRHFAGPTWEYRDGSRIVGKVAAKADGSDPARDIPWLRLDVQSHGGAGAFDPVTAVLRINTRGGVLAGPCAQPGTEMSAPYEADYVFVH